jgi:hypothetical protein
MIVHCLGPIDDWDDWTEYVPEDECDVREFAEACYLASRLGWEGDINQGPFITAMLRPSGDRSGGARAIAFKQHNNGATFVATYCTMPWLFREYGGDSFVIWSAPVRSPPVIRENVAA